MSKYLTFPMVILKNGMQDINGAIDDAINYCLYSFCLTCSAPKEKQIEDAEKELGISYGNKLVAYSKGKVFFESIPVNSPKTSLTRDMVFDFFENHKTEFEIACFLAFAALRSILQRQPYTKISNNYLMARMAGNNAKSNGEPMPEWINKYHNRYQLDKIKMELQLNWGLKLYGDHMRGFYVSFSMELSALIYQAEKRRKSLKEKELKTKKLTAKKAAIKAVCSDSTNAA